MQRILDVCQAYAESHGIIFNCNKTVCMTFKAKSARSTATPVLKSGGQYVNSVDQYKYLGIVLDTELSDNKDIQRQLRYQYCAANKLRASFSRCSNAVKNVLFRSFCTPMCSRHILVCTYGNVAFTKRKQSPNVPTTGIRPAERQHKGCDQSSTKNVTSKTPRLHSVAKQHKVSDRSVWNPKTNCIQTKSNKI